LWGKGHFIRNCTKKKEKNKYSKQNKHFLQLSKDYESADEVEFEEESSDEEEISPENLELTFREMDKDEGLYELYGNSYLWCEGELYEESHTKTSKKLLKYFEMNDLFEYENYNWKSITKKSKGKHCNKCGRNSHYASNCYAKRHVKGYSL